MKFLIALVFASLFLSVFATSQTRSEQIINKRGEVVAVEVEPGQSVREFSAQWFPDDHPRVISLKGVEIDVVDSNTIDESAVEFDISTIEQAAMAFGYFSAEADLVANTTGNFSLVKAALFAFIFRFYAPFEYAEVNGIPGFQNGTGGDIWTGLYDLSSILLPWHDLDIEENDITGTDGNPYKLFYITAETVDQVFLMRFTICGTNVQVPGAIVTSDSTKIDIAIQWFTDLHVAAPWTTGPSNPNVVPNAQVGLVVGMGALAESAQAGPGSGSDNGGSLNFTGGSFVAFCTWNNSVEVVDKNGNDFAGDVYAEVIEVDAEESASGMNGEYEAGWSIRLIFFSFEGARPSLIFWDPSLGVAPIEDSPSSDSSILAPIAALSILLAVMFS